MELFLSFKTELRRVWKSERYGEMISLIRRQRERVNITDIFTYIERRKERQDIL